MSRFDFVNSIPEDLPSGRYTTKVVSTEFVEHNLVITLEFIGGECNDNDLCLFPLIKE